MKLLITGAWQQARDFLPWLEKQHEVVFLPCERDALPCDPTWIEGIIGNGIFLHHPIGQFSNLRYIQITSAGLDRVPMDAIMARGIKLNNARGVYSIPMAEYALWGVLSLYKNQVFFTENKKNHKWEKQRNLQELYGKKVCIVGCGSVGGECAKRFEAMGCTVHGIDAVVKEQAHFSRIFPEQELQDVMSRSDIIILTLPLTEQTRRLFGTKLLGAIKDGAVLVNIARGALIQTDALVTELKKGRFRAVLDVFEEEPLPSDSELWGLENVMITPHNSFVGEGNGQRLSELICHNLEEYSRQSPKE